jgi:hypothetical protein
MAPAVKPKGGASTVRGVSNETRKKVIEDRLQDRIKSLNKYANRIHLGMCNFFFFVQFMIL